MCGIAGVHRTNGPTPPASLLLEMAGELTHRGPDGVGLYLDGPVGLVNTRLAVVDLAEGAQPLSNEDGRYWVVQNGEIYNHIELRADLEAHGHRFVTRCDTEVIVHAYEQWGPACLDRFNGPFAIAIWDRVERALFLARDRFGVRPLFITELGRELVFASEIKAILRHPGAPRRLDPNGLVEIGTLWSTLPDRTAFEGVQELAPGCWMRVGPNGREVRRWWDLVFAPPGEARRDSADDLADELHALLDDAVRLRLRADVPVAAYLSGGLDSSVLVALARTQQASIRCFGVGFDDDRFDERSHQSHVADALDVDLEQLALDDHSIASLLPRVVALAERPLLRTAPAPMLALSQRVSEKRLKVVLTGEGADELFAGYTIFAEAGVRRFWARDPASTMRPQLLQRLYPWLGRDMARAPRFTERFFGSDLVGTDDPLYSHRPRFASTARSLRFLRPELVHAAMADGGPACRLLEQLPAHVRDATPLARAQHLEISTFLSGYLLHSQGDRMLMGSSVEGRFPYLDPRVATFAASLPDGMRLRGLHDKVVLRRAAASLVPAATASRPKHPYRAPILRALFGVDAPEWVAGLLETDRVTDTGVFDARAVGLLASKAARAAKDAGPDGLGMSESDEMALVYVLSTQLLHEQLVARPDHAPAAHAARVVVGSTVHAAERVA